MWCKFSDGSVGNIRFRYSRFMFSSRFVESFLLKISEDSVSFIIGIFSMYIDIVIGERCWVICSMIRKVSVVVSGLV